MFLCFLKRESCKLSVIDKKRERRIVYVAIPQRIIGREYRPFISLLEKLWKFLRNTIRHKYFIRLPDVLFTLYFFFAIVMSSCRIVGPFLMNNENIWKKASPTRPLFEIISPFSSDRNFKYQKCNAHNGDHKICVLKEYEFSFSFLFLSTVACKCAVNKIPEFSAPCVFRQLLGNAAEVWQGSSLCSYRAWLLCIL